MASAPILTYVWSEDPYPLATDRTIVMAGKPQQTIERLIDTAVGTARRVVDLVTPGEETVERVRNKIPAPARSPSQAARGARQAATQTAGTARDAASRTAGAAKDAAARTAGTVRDGAQRTVATARDATRRTATTARGAAREAAVTARDTSQETAETATSEARRTAEEASRAVGPDYEEWTRAELYERAQELDIEGRSQMNKDELVKALYDAS
ncbi:MAG: Rho termination factor N-terminal domain-containing protein [Actinomycetota bacterium]|nr:Rho termination factor N-terminal domain-containing protein [Actinomycetota bacterium]